MQKLRRVAVFDGDHHNHQQVAAPHTSQDRGTISQRALICTLHVACKQQLGGADVLVLSRTRVLASRYESWGARISTSVYHGAFHLHVATLLRSFASVYSDLSHIWTSQPRWELCRGTTGRLKMWSLWCTGGYRYHMPSWKRGMSRRRYLQRFFSLRSNPGLLDWPPVHHATQIFSHSSIQNTNGLATSCS